MYYFLGLLKYRQSIANSEPDKVKKCTPNCEHFERFPAFALKFLRFFLFLSQQTRLKYDNKVQRRREAAVAIKSFLKWQKKEKKIPKATVCEHARV